MVFLFLLLPAIPWGLWEQQLEIKPPHFTVFYHQILYTFSKKSPSRNYISRKTFGRNYINPNVHFPERALGRIYIFQNMHLPEIVFPKRLIWQKLHLAEITFPRKLIFRKLHASARNFIIERIYITKISNYDCLFSKIVKLRPTRKTKRANEGIFSRLVTNFEKQR